MMTRRAPADREAMHAAAEKRRADIAACGRCDELGWIVIAGKAHRCPHPDSTGGPRDL